jgi:hypothetical protein
MIEFEYWQLLLFPLFFGLGWAAARIDIRHLVKESRALPRSYFQGSTFCSTSSRIAPSRLLSKRSRSIRRPSSCTLRLAASFVGAAKPSGRSGCTRI